MFTCPSKDIHSIYLDNELPAEYVREYEAHIQQCSKCKAELEKMRRIRALFQTDSSSLTLDSHAMDQGFERLQSRLNYSKITVDKNIHVFPAVKWSIPAAAAAAVLAVAVVIPLRINRTSQQTGSSVLAISRQKPAPIAQSRVVVNGNIPHTALTSLFKSQEPDIPQQTQMTAQYASLGPAAQEQEENTIGDALTGIDIFRPEFGDQDTITIHITVPHMTTIPVTSADMAEIPPVVQHR